MNTTQRTLLVAVVVAAVIGFALGWFAKVWSEPTPESRLHDAAEDIRDRLRKLGK